MKRLRTLLTIVLPSVLAGGLVFGSASFYRAHAAGPDLVGFWPAAGDVTSTGGSRRPPPPPPAPAPPPPADRDHWAVPPTAPTPPTPPTVRAGSGRKGIRVTVRDGKVTVEGISDVVRAQLDSVRDTLGANPHIPKEIRDKVNARLDKVRTIVEKRVPKAPHDIDDLGEQIEKLNEEVERALEGLDEDLAKLGSKLHRDIAKKLGKDLSKALDPDKFHFDVRGKKDKADKDKDKADKAKVKKVAPAHDSDDSDDGDDHDDSDDGDDHAGGSDDVAPEAPPTSIDWKGVKLKPSQRDAIVKLREASDKNIAAVQKELTAASTQLEKALSDPKTTDRDIIAAVDRISAHEAAIRKARLLTWIQARRLLDTDQRTKVEAAVGGTRAAAPKKP